MRNFVLAMALAQSAVTDQHKKTGGSYQISPYLLVLCLILFLFLFLALIYKASSPDEEALCHAASAHGLTFLSRSSKGVTVREERTGTFLFFYPLSPPSLSTP